MTNVSIYMTDIKKMPKQVRHDGFSLILNTQQLFKESAECFFVIDEMDL